MNAVKKFFFYALSGSALVFVVPCHSEIQQGSDTAIKYTFIKECKEEVNNINAAYSERSCPDLAGYRVAISAQEPLYFTIRLAKNGKEVSTDFTAVTDDTPITPGNAIEWHLDNNIARFMIFRLSWGRAEAPFEMQQYLVINLITDEEICVIDKVPVARVTNANQFARALIASKYKTLTTCPGA